MRSKLPVLAGLAALALVATAACTANDDGTSASGSESTASPDSGNTAGAGPAPGVTDDTVRVGITYVDLDAVRQFVDLDQGDYEDAYRAMIDDVNAGGGIHGRTIEPVFAPVSPIGTVPAEEACVRLTEDEDVFAVIGFFQDDAVLCPLETHSTAVIGGVATDARAERAAAPWFTTDPGSEAGEADAIRAMAGAGELDGRVGVFGSILSETQTNDVVLPLLEDLGIEPVDTAILDAPQDDQAAQNQATAVIAERFRSQDVDTVLAVGSAAVPLANGLAPLDYRPRLLFTSIVSIDAYVTGVNPDLALLEGAVVGSADTEQYDEEAMQECIGVLEDAGISGITDPATVETGEPIPFVSASSACRNVSLLAAILEAAGPELDFGTFQQAGESLTVHLPGSDVDYEFGPYPDVDGNLPVHLFDWDAAEAEFTLRDDG
jgi:Periplasmic binding protein